MFEEKLLRRTLIVYVKLNSAILKSKLMKLNSIQKTLAAYQKTKNTHPPPPHKASNNLSLNFFFYLSRGINRKQFTGAHVDNVYMGRGSRNLFTVWTPFGDTPVEMGTLAVCEGSNSLPRLGSIKFYQGNIRRLFEFSGGGGGLKLFLVIL